MERHVSLAAAELSSVFARQSGCKDCPTDPCPTCAADESCQVTVRTCTDCSKAYCAKNIASSSSSSSGGPNIGGIVGGVVGGLVAIAIITYCVWRFCIRNKRAQYAESWQQDTERTKESTIADFASRRSQRQSVHSVHSLASTVLTRASNIIQIAYIPGVTNRATPTSPTLLVPPVPPIPLALSDAGSPSPYEEQHFFVPGNLRDSQYSGISGYSDRTSYARTSYAPRSSVASTIYGKNAIVSPLPAQKGTLLKPSLVSVKSKATGTSSGSSTPPVPAVDYERYERPPPSPAFSIGATFFKNASASTATSVRPQVVRVGSGPKTIDVKKPSPAASFIGGEDAPEPLVRVNGPEATDTITRVDEGPFSDPPRRPTHKSSNSLSKVIEEATRRAAEGADQNASVSKQTRGNSPFGDEYIMKEW